MSNARQQLCVVLLNYRTPQLVLDCLETLTPQAARLGAKVLVVDNNSSDSSTEIIQGWIDQSKDVEVVELICAKHNGGFAAGNNVGIQSIDAEYYLLINSDTLLRENALSNMLSSISSKPKVGLLSPRLEWPDETPQESCFRFHRPISQFLGAANTGFFVKLFKNFEVSHRIKQTSENYEWTSFACIMIRKDVFDQVGLLDENFFMYFEDVEFCWRARKAGWLVHNDPEARVVHLRGGSSPVKSNMEQRKRQARYLYESRARYFFLIGGRLTLLASNVCWTSGWLIACLRALAQKRFVNPACKLEWKDIWVNFFDPEKPYVHPESYK